MEVRQLNTLIRAAQFQSFSKAAELMIESAGKIRYTIANHLYNRNVRGL